MKDSIRFDESNGKFASGGKRLLTICISQPGYGHNDGVVLISPDQVDVLTQWLKEAKAEASRMVEQGQATR